MPPDIYVLGGKNDSAAALCTVECFSPLSGEWRVMPPMMVKRYGCAACTLGGQRPGWEGWPVGEDLHMLVHVGLKTPNIGPKDPISIFHGPLFWWLQMTLYNLQKKLTTIFNRYWQKSTKSKENGIKCDSYNKWQQGRWLNKYNKWQHVGLTGEVCPSWSCIHDEI